MSSQHQHHRLSQGTTSSAALISLADTALQTIIKKESQYCDGVQMNQAFLKTWAEKVCYVQNLFLEQQEGAASSSEGGGEEGGDDAIAAIQKQLEDQKEVIRNIAKENVYREKYIRTFCDSLQNIRTKQQKEFLSQIEKSKNTGDAEGTSQEADGKDTNNILAFDYKKLIEEEMDSMLRKRNVDQEELIVQEKFYRDIAYDIFRDPKPTIATASGGRASNSNKRPNSSGSGGRRSIQDDDDDDIEIMRDNMAGTQPGGMASQQPNHLKCPITREWMIDAVENSVCSHIYSKHGIEESIKQAKKNRRSYKCPVVGCLNRDVTLEQLRPHPETILRAKREVRQADIRNKQQSNRDVTMIDNDSNALVDSDEE